MRGSLRDGPREEKVGVLSCEEYTPFDDEIVTHVSDLTKSDAKDCQGGHHADIKQLHTVSRGLPRSPRLSEKRSDQKEKAIALGEQVKD